MTLPNDSRHLPGPMEAALRRSEEWLAGLAGMRRLYDMHVRLASETDLGAALDDILVAACDFLGTERACLRLRPWDAGTTGFGAQRGFAPGSDFIERVHGAMDALLQESDEVALRAQVIEDVERVSWLSGTGVPDAARAEGIRVLQCTPMVTRKGEVVGMLGTCFRQPLLPPAEKFLLMDLLAWTAAEFVERQRGEKASREDRERHAFVLRFSDALRAMDGERSIQEQAVRMLAGHLRLDRCWIGEVSEEAGIVKVGPEQIRAGLAPMAGTYRLADYPETTRQLSVRAMNVHDAPHDSRFSEDEKALLAAFGLSGLLIVPLRKGDRNVVWALCAAMCSPRRWTEGERMLLEEIAERTWAAVERARAEATLRASEQRYRTLFETMGQGYAEMELIRDESGRVVDERWLQLNPAFERLFGVPVAQAVGSTAATFFPGLEDGWHAACEHIARSGEPVRFEQYVETLDRWFEVFAYPRGGDRITVLYEDVTGRARAVAELERTQRRLHLALAAAQMGTWSWQVAADLHHRDENLNRLLGLAPEVSDLPIERFFSLVHPADRDRVRAAFEASVRQGRSLSTDFRVVWPDGQVRWLSDQGDVFGEGDERHLAGACIDITSRKKAEESVQLASLVYQNSSEAMAVLDAGGNFLSVNPAFTALTGYTFDDLQGEGFGLLRCTDDASAAERMLRSIDDAGHWRGEMCVLQKSGDAIICAMNLSAIVDADRQVQRHVALFSDITRRKKSEETIWRQANFDTLTGLPNRSMFLDHLELEIRKSRRAGLPLALMFLDLDHFKDVNDTLGHAVGDQLLQEAARRLHGCIRDTDLVARLGGDEFTVVMGELVDRDATERVAREILCRLAEPYRIADNVFFITASIGVTLYPEDAGDRASLLKNADQAMYAAKSQGRNCFHYFTPAMHWAAQERMRLIHDLRSAVTGDQFELMYQPIVDLATGTIHKAEALIRWHHPTQGTIEPERFIPVAEETGIIVDIGNWVFREAARHALHWRARYGEAFRVSVNLSPAQFQGEGFHASMREQATAAGLAVEITEGMLLDASAEVRHRLGALRDAGVQVSLDDFGTGYSSLSYLKKLDLDYLKIDRSFVRNLAADSDELALCEAIIVMAHKLGLKVISEGIETDQQHALLARAGCDYGQGFLYSQALPAAEFEGLLRERVRH